MKIDTLLVWVRRELRVHDHPALWWAAHDARSVIPLYVIDGEFERQAPAKRKVTIDALHDFRESLLRLGGNLVIRRGEPHRVIHQMIRETNSAGVYLTNDVHPDVRTLDVRLENSIKESGKLFRAFEGHTLVAPTALVRSAGGAPYKVFTPYRNAWRARCQELPPPLNPLRRISSPSLPSGEIPTVNFRRAGEQFQSLRGGEKSAVEDMEAFLDTSLASYTGQRDFPALRGTSRLSHHLASGSLGIRTLHARLHSTLSAMPPTLRKQGEKFLDELIWREFYYQILCNFPHVARGSFKPVMDGLGWSHHRDHLDAWRAGMTGYPMVDAAMRQLLAEGWMHNRSRMIVANFLVKDLHIHWQTGEKHFMAHLADGDTALNNGGWQWCAGTGTDAQPWFRILNPVLQSEKFDPNGEYIRQYVAELQSVPTRYIHNPWLMPSSLQQQCGCIIGRDYPKPVVDHAKERIRTIRSYSRLRGNKSL